MRVHNNLPGYYNGLTAEVVRGPLPAQRATFPTSRNIYQIPMLQSPVEAQDRYQFRLNVSGVRLEDISVVVRPGELLIEVEKEFDPYRVAHTNWDKCHGVFRRLMQIPENIASDWVCYQVVGGELIVDIFKSLEARNQAQTSSQVQVTQEIPEPSPQAEL